MIPFLSMIVSINSHNTSLKEHHENWYQIFKNFEENENKKMCFSYFWIYDARTREYEACKEAKLLFGTEIFRNRKFLWTFLKEVYYQKIMSEVTILPFLIKGNHSYYSPFRMWN